MKIPVEWSHGQAAHCAICRKPKIMPADLESEWHCFASRGTLVYVCGTHFIPDKSAGETFETCYARVLRTLGITI